MKKNHLFRVLAVSAAIGGWVGAQPYPNPIPARILGQLSPNATLDDVVQFRGLAPNGVEGRELNSPLGVAVDASGPEPIVYVVDTENNRVLGWKRTGDLYNGRRADVVLGQRDFYSTYQLGGAPVLPQGLYYPTSAVCDNQGNLFVYDAGNNRILRYPRPFEQTTEIKTADLVIGQPALVMRNTQGQLIVPGAHNQGLSGPNQATLRSATRTSSTFTPYFGVLAFDKDGNLWATDPGNHRVLRYPASRVSGPSNTVDGGEAVQSDLVLGQPDFNTAVAGSGSTSSPTVIFNNRINKARLRYPSAVAVDQSGNVFVSDDLSRVLVYRSPQWTGKDADRVMGIVVVGPNQTIPPINDIGFAIEVAGTTLAGGPRGLFTIGDQLFVIDSTYNRIMRFDPVSTWPAENVQISPKAVQVIGQTDFNNALANRGWLEPWTNTLAFPTAAAASGSELFIADSGNNRVLVLPNPAEAGPNTEATLVLGQPSFEFRSPNLTEGREFAPGGLAGIQLGVATALDQTGDHPPRLYVADPGNNRILGYSDARKIHEGGWAELVIGQVDFWRTLVNSPTGEAAKATETGLQMPSAVAVDADGNLWVADTGNGRVVRYPRPFDNPGGPHIPDIVIGKRDANSRFSSAVNETNLLYPVSIAFTNDGHLVVADAGHHRVLLFRKDFSSGMAASLVLGQPDFISASAGSNPESLNFPLTVATDTSDRIYVGDYGNGQLKIFAPIWGLSPGATPGLTISAARNSQFRPNSIAVSRKTGIIYLVDGAGIRVVTLPDYDRILSTEINSGTPAIPLVTGIGGRHVTLDKSDNLILTDGAHRVMFHYPMHTVLSYGNAVDKIAPSGLAVLLAPGVKFAETPVGEPTAPLPRAINSLEVLVNGVPAPLRQLDDNKVTLQVPSGTPYNTNVEFRVRNVETWEVLAHQWIRVEQIAPAFIAANAPGAGQVRALNPDGSANSSSRPVERNQEITLFLTGQGAIEGLPEDGTASEVAVHHDGVARVGLGTRFAEIVSSTLDPNEPGVWRVKVKVPSELACPAGSCATAIVMDYFGRRSNTNRQGQIISPNFNTIAIR
jgi:uncharacterized protein (TIGR03437 family)